MGKEYWIHLYECALEELAEEHDFDPFNVPEHIENLAIEMANNPSADCE